MISPEQLEIIKKLPAKEQEELLQLVRMLDRAESIDNARSRYIDFVKHCWTQTEAESYVDTAHWRKLGQIFDALLRGEIKRVIINMAPRVGKSRAASLFLPAYFLGKNPKHSIIQATHTASFSIEWGEKVRDLVDSPKFREIFPDVSLKADNKAKGHWKTSHGGEYFAVGAGGRMVGRNADLMIIDDPHPLAIETEIPTPRGFVRMDELRVGDEVFGPDGLPTKVTAVSEIYERPLWRVTAWDGSEVLCGKGHLWTVRKHTSQKHPYSTMTTEEVCAWLAGGRQAFLPRHKPVQFPEAKLPIDPWVLGAWLGDGTSTAGKITSHPDDQPYMRARFEAAGYQTTDQKDPYNFGVLDLWPKLKAEGLLGNKHIPASYLTASVGQRLALIQGLMDTDGNVTAAGQCVFDNDSEQIANGVVELLHSLGVRARLWSRADRRYGDERVRYRVAFKLQDAAGMPRKRERIRPPTIDRHRSIKVAETGRSGKMLCITVDREDGLFLAGRGYLVTHNSEQDGKVAAYKPEVFDRVYEWYLAGPRQRLTPNSKLLLIQTRWGLRDLTGRIIARAKEVGQMDDWHVVEFPAIFPDGKHLAAERFPLDYWLGIQAEYPASYWNSVYQQNPTSEEGALVKREWWKPWDNDRPPECKFILQSWDTAYLKTERSDFCACTTWGVFEVANPDGRPVPAVILLDAFKERMEFPELKAKAKQLYKEKQPDCLLIEAKAAGAPLVSELRSMGIPVSEYTPSRGNDKIARVNAISDLFKSGWVYFMPGRMNEEVIEEFAAFPSGQHDDMVDSGTQALLRFRRGGFIKTSMDYDYDEDDDRPTRRRVRYY